MNKWKPLLALLLVFTAGVVLGVVGTQMVVRRVIREMVAQPELVRQRIELNLARRLRLDPMQRRQVNRILADSQDQLRQLRQDTQPRFGAITSNAEAQISALLAPQQRREFERLKQENRRFLQLGVPAPPPGGARGFRGN